MHLNYQQKNFKTLRRNGYIEKIIDLRNKSYDKINSLC